MPPHTAAALAAPAAPIANVAPARRPALLNGPSTDQRLLARLARVAKGPDLRLENVSVATCEAVARLHGARMCPPIARSPRQTGWPEKPPVTERLRD